MTKLHPSFYTLPLLEHWELPASVAARIERVEATRHDSWRHRLSPAGRRVDLDDVQVVFFPGAYGLKFSSVRRRRRLFAYSLLVPLVLGMAGLALGGYGLVTVPGVWAWVLIGALVVLGIGLLPIQRYLLAYASPYRPDGLCLTPEGMCRMHDPTEPPAARRYQFFPWQDLVGFGYNEAKKLVARRRDGVEWAIVSGPIAEERRKVIEAWWQGRRDVSPVPPSARVPFYSLRGVGVRIFWVVVACGFCLAAMYPSRSAAGKCVIAFLGKLSAHDYAGARAMLSKRAKRRHPLAIFAQTLPKSLVRQRSANLNGITTYSGCNQTRDCIGGRVHWPGDSAQFRIYVLHTKNGPRIDEIHTGHLCW